MSEQNAGAQEDNAVVVSPGRFPLTVEYVPRNVTMHSVSSTELDTVGSLGNSIHLTFFGLCAGAAVAFTVVLTTANVPDPRTFAGYVAALVVSTVLSIYFGIRGAIDHRAAKQKLKDIKGGK